MIDISLHNTDILQFTIQAHTNSSPRHLHYRPRSGHLRTLNWQQSRSLSLFGWGSSKTSEPDLAKQDSTTLPEISSTQPIPIKPVRAPSDTPNTSTAPHTPEPQVLHDIENAIAVPHPEPLLSPEVELSSIPESVGYLKEVCGLDYGWGPTSMLQFVVEHIHINGGLAWGASIVSVAVLIRLLVFPMAMAASDQSIKMKQMTPLLKPLQEDIKKASLAKDTAKQLEVRVKIQTLNKEYGVKYSRLFLPILIQVPLGFSGFRLFRGMASLPVPALETEKWLWINDLTTSDPYIILPLISGATLYTSLKVRFGLLIVERFSI